MKITFLGTGTSTGIPLIGSSHPVCLSQNTKDKRLRSSIKIDFDDNTYIIDCGPDFRQQMINSNCKNIDGHGSPRHGDSPTRFFFANQIW